MYIKALKDERHVLPRVIVFVFILLCLCVCVPSMSVRAYAEDRISHSTTYDETGAAHVTLAGTSGARFITYTTDGTTPTNNSELYTGELVITYRTELRVADFDSEGERISGIKFTVSPKTANPEIWDTVIKGKCYVALTCETPNAVIYYTTDGSIPTEESEKYDIPLILTETTRIRTMALCDGYTKSSTISKKINVEAAAEENTKKTETADEVAESTEQGSSTAETVSDKSEGVESESTQVKIRYNVSYSTDTGITTLKLTKRNTKNKIYYTSDGSAPSKSSKVYNVNKLLFNEPSTVRALEYSSSGKLVASLKINLKVKCAPAKFSCESLSATMRTVTMTTDTPGATIYYTIDGRNPVVGSSTKYTGPVSLSGDTKIRAIVAKSGNYIASKVVTQFVGDILFTLKDINYDDILLEQTADLINLYRTRNGLGYLELRDDIIHSASVRAMELSVYNDHTRPSGRKYFTALLDYGVDYNFVGEIITANCDTAQEVFDTIMLSPDNKSLLSDKNFDSIGVGYYQNGDVKYWAILLVMKGTTWKG